MSVLDEQSNIGIMKKRILKAYKFGCLMTMSREFAEEARVDFCGDFLGRDMAFRIVQKVMGAPGVAGLTIEYPADWWEAVKNRFFPQWAKRRWPVVMTRHHIDSATLFPDIAIGNAERRYFLENRITNSSESDE